MQVKVNITSKFSKKGYSAVQTFDVESFSVDAAMDTDTDSWTLEIGDPLLQLHRVLHRDNEVRIGIFAKGIGPSIHTLNTGFADEISLNESNLLSFRGRDITAVAVDSQRPPGNFQLARPEVFVARDARALRIGDRLRLTKAKSFRKFAVDGSESYWEVWYRLYRKRRMWLWAEPDATLVAGTLNYNSRPSYFFGGQPGQFGRLQREGWIPTERVEIRSNKQQRIWEVYVIGNRGDLAFVSKARDNTVKEWIRRRQVFLRSSTAHNPAEARVEAWEELFEGKVGAVEIKLVIADPGHVIRQNRIARVDIKEIGLKGDFFVVGVRVIGNASEGLYQEIRLRERKYAISKRVPDDPSTEETPSGGVQGTLADVLEVRWKSYFIEAANKHHGPWPYKLFLGVLLAMCEQETGFRNVRGGGSIEYPGTSNGQIPSQVTNSAAFAKFAATFANDPRRGRVHNIYAVGPMQLFSDGFKDYADSLSGITNDELGGGRWMPRYNIIGGAFALRAKLKDSGAEGAVGRGGSADQLIWQGVAGYGHHYSGEPAYDPRNRYAREVKARYEDTYRDLVEEALATARKPPVEISGDDVAFEIPQASVAELRNQILNSKMITFGSNANRDDIRFGQISIEVMRFIVAFTEIGGFHAVITSLKTGHSKYVARSNRVSAHYLGRAVDIGNFNISRPAEATLAQNWILDHKVELGYKQLIGPIDSLVYPLGLYDSATLAGHDNHLHIGY